ncbi:hypothetical protein [Rhodoferax sp. PAMC 29310]|uniref:hypothetical protein n=1 Tax=Rhodoferax sp. PAMC 29310 TaxID=2822760 RepID=UPI001B31E828|nr:hypothetical protein [Rhodoferax sp. PAMC 29310]
MPSAAPSPDAQANLLPRFERITPADLQRVQGALELAGAQVTRTPATSAADAMAGRDSGTGSTRTSALDDPNRFLLAVMNDPAAERRWLIEAARALLPYVEAEIRVRSQQLKLVSMAPPA